MLILGCWEQVAKVQMASVVGGAVVNSCLHFLKFSSCFVIPQLALHLWDLWAQSFSVAVDISNWCWKMALGRGTDLPPSARPAQYVKSGLCGLWSKVLYLYCPMRHQVMYLSYGYFWDLSKWGWQNEIIFLKLAGSEAHLRPSCSPVTHQEVLCTESLKTKWHWTTKEGDERDALGNAAGIIHKFSNIIFISIFHDSNVAAP